MAYHVKLETFEGPLDLLLYLIKKDEVDIWDIPIATITAEYLEYINMMKLLDLNVVGEFLVMAATLVKIKSRMLLPQKEEGEDGEIEDPRSELVEQLLEYEMYKERAKTLGEKEEAHFKLYSRPPMEISTSTVAFDASLFDLLTAFRKVLEEKAPEIVREIVPFKFTLEEKVQQILDKLSTKNELRFSLLFKECQSKRELIVTFLALLEIIKQKKIRIRQPKLFGEIAIYRTTV
jgi:segregation and condensation protein A